MRTPLLIASLALLTTPAARAEVTAPASAESASTEEDVAVPYQRAINEAISEHKLGHFEEAREHLRHAHELFPNARTLRGLAKIEFELRNYGESVKLLEAALASQVRPLDAELRAEVQALLDRARAYVGEVHVLIDPGTATISVDGSAVAQGPQAELELLVGDHVLEFQAAGCMPERRRVRVMGQQRIDVQIRLLPPLLASAARDAQASDARTTKRRWLWVGLGVVAAGAVTGIAVAATRDRSSGSHDRGGTSSAVIPNL